MHEAREKITRWLEEHERGSRKTHYKLRDWLFSRQRYWGEPFPMIFVDGRPRPLPDDVLPVTLPEVDEFKPSGSVQGPLASVTTWVRTTDPRTGEPAERETNTMPQWAGSCWYFLRFLDPRNEDRLVDPAKERAWMPVDLYIGGSEHAVLHLLYARFWQKVLYDAGVVSTSEPFAKLIHQGMILGEMEYVSYLKQDGSPVSFDRVLNGRAEDGEPVHTEGVEELEVEKSGDFFVLKRDPAVRVEVRASKMSKSRGNVINPEDVIERYGADALRMYEMFMGPLEQVKPWSMHGVEGVHRFLSRVWRLLIDPEEDRLRDEVVDIEPSREQLRALHRTIRKVTDDIDALHFNTAIAAMMEFVNAANKWDAMPVSIARPFALILSPFAPHVGEELWNRLGGTGTLAYESWPIAVEAFLQEDEVEIAVQVNGRVRGAIRVPSNQTEERDCMLDLARSEENVDRYLKAGTVQREIYVPGRIINFVVR